MRQYTDTGGIAMDVTIISATCDGVSCVPRNRFTQNAAVITAQTTAHAAPGDGHPAAKHAIAASAASTAA